MEFVLFLWLVSVVVFGILGTWIAQQKRREPGEGLILGTVFGPFGCLIEALLPTVDQADLEQKRQQAERSKEQWVRDDEAARKQLEKIQQEERERREIEAVEWACRADARRAAWAARLDGFDETFRWFVRFGWFRTLPDTLQPIVAGLAIALPLVALTAWGLKHVLPQSSGKPAALVIQDEPESPPWVYLPPHDDTKLSHLAESLVSIKGEALGVLREFLEPGAPKVLYFLRTDRVPHQLVASGILRRGSGGAVDFPDGQRLPYYLEPEVRFSMSKHRPWLKDAPAE